METRALADADAVAREGARVIAVEARAAVTARGRFIVAVSGGRTPWRMLRALAGEDVPWSGVHVVQVDERIAPAGDRDRIGVGEGSSLHRGVSHQIPRGERTPSRAPAEDPNACVSRRAPAP